MLIDLTTEQRNSLREMMRVLQNDTLPTSPMHELIRETIERLELPVTVVGTDIRPIGDARRELFTRADSAWNSWVREITAECEMPDNTVDMHEVNAKLVTRQRRMHDEPLYAQSIGRARRFVADSFTVTVNGPDNDKKLIIVRALALLLQRYRLEVFQFPGADYESTFTISKPADDAIRDLQALMVGLPDRRNNESTCNLKAGHDGPHQHVPQLEPPKPAQPINIVDLQSAVIDALHVLITFFTGTVHELPLRQALMMATTKETD